MKHALNVLVNVVLILSKLAVLLAAVALSVAIHQGPAFWLALNVHWAAGVASGILLLVIELTLLTLALERSKSERPVFDWLTKTIPERTRQ